MAYNLMTKKFSGFPDFRIRILLHCLAWTFIFALFILTSKSLFRTEITAPPVFLYSMVIVLIIFFNHYYLSVASLPAVSLKWGWARLILEIFILYIFSAAVAISSLQILANRYPAYHSFRAQSERRKIEHFSDLFSYPVFTWVLTVVIFYNLLLLFIKIAKSAYETNIKNALLVSENMSLELNFLRSQIQPHFLFNTLNNIYGLVLDNRQASESILKLSDLLRFSLYESKAPNLSLKRESDFLADYINLEQMRHNRRVTIAYDFLNIENDRLPIAPLLLVNFIENAFKHGVNSSIDKCWVKICLFTKGNLITFIVENSKPDETGVPVKQEGLGLVNTRRRLELIYPDKHTLTIRETEKEYFIQLEIYAS